MRKKILATFIILLTGFLTLAQTEEACSYGTLLSEETSNGDNISTGGLYEYTAASDFDVPFGIVFTVDQVTFNVLKGAEDLSYVNLYILENDHGAPGEVLHAFENQIPVGQEFAYTTSIPDMDAYEITVDIPTSFDLTSGKYYLQLQGAPGDEVAVSWEILPQENTSLGRFDFTQFEDEGWFGGFAYYDHVFEVSGMCTTVDEEPYYGDACDQSNESNDYETGFGLVGVNLADDFIVAEDTTFYLKTLKISTLQLGNILHAVLTIRANDNGTPGDIIQSFENKGPQTENFFGYTPISGYPLDVAAVDVTFEFDEPIELTEGTYFIDVQVTPFPFTDVLTWEATSLPGIGGPAYSSNNNGETWDEIEGYNLVYKVSGYCSETLATADLEQPKFSYFPNPLAHELTIKASTAIKSIQLYNAVGQLVIQASNSSTIPTATLPSGIYFVKTELENGNLPNFKIVKK